MEIIDYLLARKKAGGGSDVTIEQLSITENGTYSEEGIAYSPVVVNVPTPANSYQLKDVPSGTVSTIDDGTALPMPSLKVDIEPVQDLHGYDHPWADGAGKNLFPYLKNETTYGVALTVDKDGTITLNGTCTNSYNFMISGTIEAGNYSLCDFAEGQWPSSYSRTQIYGANVISLSVDNLDASQAVKNATVTNGGNVTFRIRIENGFTYNNNKLKPMLVKETVSTMTYEPYSNICPISGWTAANVTRTGKNLFNIDDVKNLKVSDVSGLMRFGVIIKGSGEFSISVNPESLLTSDYMYCRSYNSDGSITNTYYIISGTTVTPANFSLTQGQYLILYDAVESSLSLSKERMERWKPQIEVGSTATAYEPYNGQTYTIEFKDGDNPITVYGGTLDVTSGELTVTDAHIASYNAETLPSTWISDRDVYAEGATPTTGAEVVYKLANSVTYHLTPTQVRTLVGNNNIWADTGNIIEGKYFKSLV